MKGKKEHKEKIIMKNKEEGKSREERNCFKKTTKAEGGSTLERERERATLKKEKRKSR